MEDEPHGQIYYNKAFSHTNNQGKTGDFSITCQNYKYSPAVAQHFCLSSHPREVRVFLYTSFNTSVMFLAVLFVILQKWLLPKYQSVGELLNVYGICVVCNTIQSFEKNEVDLYVSACVLSCFSHVWLFVIPWTVARQACLSVGFSGKNTGGAAIPSSRKMKVKVAQSRPTLCNPVDYTVHGIL